MPLRERFLDLLEDIPVGLFVSRPDGTIVAANRALAKILRCPNREVLLQCKATDFYVDPVDREIFIKTLRSKGSVEAFETKFKCFDGQIIYAALSARLYRHQGDEVLSGIIQDLTALRHALKRLLESEEKFQVITETAPEAILGFDKEGKIIFWNRAASKLFDYTSQEIIGKSWRTLWATAGEVGFNPGEPVEIELRKKTGKTFPAEVVLSLPVNLEGQKVTFAFIRNIYLRKELEKKIIQEEKTKALQLMARGFIHDFNNLFFVFKGQLELAKLNPAKIQKVLERLDSISERLESLLEQLALFAGLKKASPKALDLVSFVKKVVPPILYGSKIELLTRFPTEEIRILGDEVQLAQVFQNLILNAREALNDKGKIEINIRKVKIGSKESAKFEIEPGDYVEIMVKDYGSGIPKDRLERIFEPYFSTKPQGAGLGLALVQSIIKEHKGHITVDSKEGSFTAFYIYLPLIAA